MTCNPLRVSVVLAALASALSVPSSAQCLVQVLDPTPNPAIETSLEIYSDPMTGTDIIVRGNAEAGVVDFFLEDSGGNPVVATISSSPGFGTAVAGDAELVAISNPRFNDGAFGAGLVRPYEQVFFGIFGPETALTSPTGGALLSQFGASVSLSGDLLVVGEPDTFGSKGTGGEVHVYRRVGDDWTLEDTLSWPSVGTFSTDLKFGFSTDVTSIAAGGPRDAIIVGAPDADDGGSNSGTIYIFVHDGSTWQLNAWWFFTDTENWRLGSSVAIDGDNSVVSAPAGNIGATDGGHVWFQRWNGTFYDASFQWWGNIAGELLGNSVDLDGSTAALGATGHDGIEGSGNSIGGVVMLRETPLVGFDTLASVWTTYPNGLSDVDRYGARVALNGDRMAVEAPGQDSVCADCGRVYVSDISKYSWQWDFSLGGAASGTNGEPVLYAEGSMCLDEEFRLIHDGAAGSALTWLVIGFSPLNLPLSGVAGLLVPFPDLILGPFSTDPAGRLELPLTIDSPLPTPLPIWWQFWTLDAAATGNFSASNGMLGTIP